MKTKNCPPQFKCYILQLLLLVIIVKVEAQSISGNVQGEDGSKIEYATLTLMKLPDSSLVKGTLTDSLGRYEFRNISFGKYFISAFSVGFTKTNSNSFEYSGQNVLIEPILLKNQTTELGVVIVSATKPLIEHDDDKIIFNTTSDPSSKSENALDIIRKTPFLSVDGNDNVLMNGQTNFKVLLNGRETGMFSTNLSQALKSISGASILRIEVITNPSAKYDAEGVGGVINIVTVKKIVGYNGNTSLTISSLNFGFGNLNLNAKKGKIGISLNYNFFKQGYFGLEFPPMLVNSRVLANNSQTYSSRTSYGSTIQNLFQNNGYAEFNYELDSLKTLSIYSGVTGGYNNLHTEVTNQANFDNFTRSSYFDFKNNIQNPNYSFGGDFVKKFYKTSDKEFSIKVFSVYSKNNSFLDSYQDNQLIDRYISNINYSNNLQTTFQSDYILPLKNNAKLETGVKLILRNATSDYESLTKSMQSEKFTLLPENSNNFDYKQQVYSGYGSYNFKMKDWAFRTGIRLEHTEVNGNFKSSGSVVTQSYTNFIPNIQASTALSKAYKIILNYGQRIQRPFINSLNPFINNNDTLSISYGNPQLKPQLIRNFTLQNNITKGKVFASLTLGGSYSNDKIIDISTFNKQTGVTTTESQNLGVECQLSMNGNLTAALTNKWNMSFNSTFIYASIKNLLENGQENKGFSGNFGLNNTIKLNPKFTVSTFTGYFKPPVGLQGQTGGQWFYNITPNYKFMKDKFTLSFAMARFFTQYMTVKTTLADKNFTSENSNSFQARNFRLGLTYNFGKLTENISKKKGVNNDDVVK